MAKSKSKSPQKSKAKAPSAAGAAGGTDVLARIADAIERLAPQRAPVPDLAGADAFIWQPDGRRLAPVKHVNRVEMSLLKGIDRVRDVLVENTERFAKGLPANNALLWGARGTGASRPSGCHTKASAAAKSVSGARCGASRSSAPAMRARTSALPLPCAVEADLALGFCGDLDFDLAIKLAFRNCAALSALRIAPASGPTRKRPKMAGFEGSCGVAIGATAAIVRAKLGFDAGPGTLAWRAPKTTQGMLRCSFRRRLPKGRCSAGQAAIAAT